MKNTNGWVGGKIQCSLRFVSKGNVDETTEEEEECNIWEESADSPDNITFEKNKEKAIQNIESATLNKLVERVTSPEEYGTHFLILSLSTLSSPYHPFLLPP